MAVVITCASPSSVGPQADTFSREREEETEDHNSYAIVLPAQAEGANSQSRQTHQIGSPFVPTMTAPAPTPDDAPIWARPLYERQIDVSGQLADAGLQMALLVRDQTMAATQEGSVEPATLESFTRAYTKAARATRLSVMLQEKLVKDLIAFERGDPALAARVEEDRVASLVRVFVDPESERVERQKRETREQLDRECHEDARLTRAIGELMLEVPRAFETSSKEPATPSLSGESLPTGKRRDMGGFRCDYPHRPSG
jgi:hypothetical protein